MYTNNPLSHNPQNISPTARLAPSIMEKLRILSDAAKYDVACTSSGVDRQGDGTGIGNTLFCGICHSFAADGRCVSLLNPEPGL